MEDHVYGADALENVLAHFNVHLHKDDPDYLHGCVLREGTDPIFAYSRGSLSFQMPAPEFRNPADWLLDQTRITPHRAVATLYDDLASIEYDVGPSRWTIASYNSPFDVAVLGSFARRVLGDTKAKKFLNTFTMYSLDILQLARWGIHSGKILSYQAGLKSVAAALGITYTEDPNKIALTDLVAAEKVASYLLYGVDDDYNQKPRIARSEVQASDVR
jgi:DNA polymerase III epsilon subunit-like protein